MEHFLQFPWVLLLIHLLLSCLPHNIAPCKYSCLISFAHVYQNDLIHDIYHEVVSATLSKERCRG